MAIQFLNALDVQGNIDLNANQIVQVRIENLGTNPAATAGRMYYNSGDGSLRYYDGVGASWISLDGTGDVDSIAVATGAASSGNLLTLNSATGAVTISSHAYAGTSSIGYVPTGGTSATFLRGDGTWVTPTDSTPVDSVDETTPGTSAGTPIVVNPTTGTVLVQSMAYAGTTNVGHVPTGGGASTFLRGDGTWVTPSGAYTDWNLAGDSGTPQDITDGNTATFAGGTGIATVAGATDTLTITNTGVTSNVAGTGISVSGATGAVTITNTGVTSIVAGTGISISGATGAVTVTNTQTETDTTYTLPTTNGNNPDLVLTAGGSGSGTDIVNLNGTGTTVKVTGSGTDTITFDLVDDVTIAGELTVSGTGQSSFGGQLTIPTTPSASTDAASKAYVDTATTGALVFQGGYDASTNPNTSAEQGWTYVVTTGGTGVAGFWSVALEIGDLIIANQDDPVDEDDWTEVNKNVTLATTTTVGVASFSSSNFTVSGAGAVSISNVDLGTETSGNYTLSVAPDTEEAKLGISVDGAIGEGQVALVGLDITNALANYTSVADSDELVIYSINDDKNEKVTVANLRAATVAVTSFTDLYPQGGAASSWTVTHNLSSKNVIVQCYRTSDNVTVFTDVVRTSTSVVTITCGASQAEDTIQVMVIKAG
jgi:hypothetical protein